MGATKEKNGDGHVLFHVGKELPEKGSNLLLVPGIQTAQGRGVYFSDEPRLKYTGGEAFKKQLDIVPIFCVPMYGKWIRGKNKMKNKGEGGEISYHSNERLVALRNLDYVDGELEGRKVRYYFPKDLSFFKEPDTQRMGRHVTSRFSENVLGGKVDFENALGSLHNDGIEEEVVTEEYILERMLEAVNNGRIPAENKLSERLNEIRMSIEHMEGHRLVA